MDALCSNCLQVFAALSNCERRKNSLTSAFVDGCERREWGRLGLKYASPLKKGKSHAIWVLSETLSPPIEKFFAQDLQLLRPPALLPTTNKPQNRKRGGQLQGFINLAKSHGSLVACWCNIGDFLWKEGTLIFRISRQILGQGDRVLLQGGLAGKLER